MSQVRNLSRPLVYWINDRRTLMKVSLHGGAPVPIAWSGPRGPSIEGLAVDEVCVYFWDADGNVLSLSKDSTRGHG